MGIFELCSRTSPSQSRLRNYKATLPYMCDRFVIQNWMKIGFYWEATRSNNPKVTRVITCDKFVIGTDRKEVFITE